MRHAIQKIVLDLGERSKISIGGGRISDLFDCFYILVVAYVFHMASLLKVLGRQPFLEILKYISCAYVEVYHNVNLVLLS